MKAFYWRIELSFSHAYNKAMQVYKKTHGLIPNFKHMILSFKCRQSHFLLINSKYYNHCNYKAIPPQLNSYYSSIRNGKRTLYQFFFKF